MTFFLVTFHKHYLFRKENDSIPFMLRGSDIQKKMKQKTFETWYFPSALFSNINKIWEIQQKIAWIQKLKEKLTQMVISRDKFDVV
jgi:hypothetical protein